MSSAGKIKLASLDELLGTGNPAAGGMQQITPGDSLERIPLKLLHVFHSHSHGHPFRVLDDAKMAETLESVQQHGVLLPGIVRPDKDYPGEYEVIAGHRRWRASELAGLPDMPFIVKHDLNDWQASEIMVDTNIQREDLLESERAWAYRIKYDAIKGMGRDDGMRNDMALAEQAGISRQTIQRYIRLTYLLPELLEQVDRGKLPRNTASELSYLAETEQQILMEIMEQTGVVPSGKQALELKQRSKSERLTSDLIQWVLLGQEERTSGRRIALQEGKIRTYFPKSYTGEQIEEVIYNLLEEWKRTNGNRD